MIPAVESGINNMFQQINQSLQSFQPAASATSAAAQDPKAMEKLQSSLDQVLNKLSSFESQLTTLSTTVKDIQQQLLTMPTNAGAPADMMMPPGWYPGAPIRLDPHYLLSQGRVSEALELVVNQENVAILIDLLSKIETQTLISQCSRPVQLCVVHRLVEDLVVVDPIEGWSKRMEWVKALIMTLISSMSMTRSSSLSSGYNAGAYLSRQRSNESVAGVDNVAEYHLQSVMQQLYQFLGQILERLMNSIKSPSKANATSSETMSVPPSMLIADIQLLMAALGSKLT
jgi:hypothetical protein